ncbi:transcription elongation factor, partial [Vibrio parahaemolyticus]|nr:transcription elongation factor [Vibrio parahaemolyticus]
MLNARPKSMNKADLVPIIIQHLEEKLQVAHASAQRA